MMRIGPELLAAIRRLIKQEIDQMARVILTARSENSTGKKEDVAQLYPDQPSIVGRAIMRPYGVVSRAPKGTTSVAARLGSHPGNRTVLGHRDEKAPDLDNEGDVMLYDASGAQILLSGGTIKVGTGSGNAAARKNDAVKVTIPAGSFLVSCSGSPAVGVLNPDPVDVTGTITAGSSKVQVED